MKVSVQRTIPACSHSESFAQGQFLRTRILMSTFSEELLRGACLAHHLNGTGDAPTLHARLGAHLVEKLLSADARARHVAQAQGQRQLTR